MPALTMKNGPLAGRRLAVTEPLTLGRENVDLPVDAPTISRRHAVVRPVDGALEIEDLGSRNGTWVNGDRIEGPTRLAAGDVVGLGAIIMVVDRDLAATAVSQPAVAARAEWTTLTGKRVAVHAPPGSYPERVAAAELRDAERAVGTLTELLAPPGEVSEAPVDIYLTDAVAGAAGVPAGGDAIVRTLQPEAPGEPIAFGVTELLVRRWFGPAPASAALFVRGIGGVVAGRLGAGASVEEADGLVRTELASGSLVSVFGRGDEASADIVATSFVAFLLRTHGPEALRRFLSDYDQERRDHAATSAFQRPLASLEELWIGSLREVTGFRSTLRALLGHLLPLMRPFAARWLEIFAYMLFGIAYTVMIPLSFKYLFDTVIPDGSLGRLGIFVGVLFAIFVANTAVTMRRSYVTAVVNQHVLLGLQERMFERLQRLSHSFYGRAKVGDLMSRLSQDLNTVQQATSAVLAEGVFLLLSALGAGITAVVLSPLLGALVLVVVPLFALSYLLLLSRLRQASLEVQTVYGQVAAGIQENLSAQPLVKALGLEERSIGTYRGRLRGLLRGLLRVVLLSSLFEASVGLAVTLGQLLIIGAGGYLVIEGHMTFGTLVAFIGLLPTFFQPITALANVGQEVQQAAGAMERMLEILEEPIAIADRSGAATLAPVSRGIALEDVTFGYEPGRPILRNLQMAIPAGKHVAIVGPSGSGKSTIVNLLMRFWDADEGRVFYDGVDIRDATVASLRGQVGLVFQDTFVFDTTLRENIAVAREGATDQQVLAAARAARLEGWIASLPAGAETVLGERGVRMSGGQRQRLAIARALVRDPAVLILDEATSALDARTEAEILETLDAAARGRTTISITHRLSLAARSDHVFVLEEGEVVEEGTHAELARAGGPYQRLYDEQAAHVNAGLAPIGIEAARLRAIPLFAGLGHAELAELAERLVVERHDAGHEVVRQGEDGRKAYLVASGQLEVAALQGGRERRINILNEGDYFGEMALLTDEPRVATVRATMATELYSLTRSDFVSVLEQDPEARRAVEDHVAARARALAQATRAATGIRPLAAPLERS